MNRLCFITIHILDALERCAARKFQTKIEIWWEFGILFNGMNTRKKSTVFNKWTTLILYNHNAKNLMTLKKDSINKIKRFFFVLSESVNF